MAGARLSKIRISYKKYDAEGRELSGLDQDMLTDGRSSFFQSEAAKRLIGTEAHPGLLNKYAETHAKHVKDVEGASQDNLTSLLKKAATDVQVNITTLLFPPLRSKDLTDFQEETKTLYDTVWQAATWVDSHPSDEDAELFLKQIGEYAESKIIALPWHEPVQPELYFMIALSGSKPSEFLKVKKDTKLSGYVTEYISELNQVRHDYPKNVVLTANGNLSEEVQKFAAKINEVHQRFGQEGINGRIKYIEGEREKRAKKWFGFIRNFFKFREKRELNDLKKIESSNTLVAVFNKVAKGTATIKEKYDYTAKLINAKKVFDELKGKWLQNNEQFLAEDVVKLKDAVVILLTSKDMKPNADNFLKSVKEQTLKNIKVSNEKTVAGLANAFLFFKGALDKDADPFAIPRIAVVEAVKERLKQFYDAKTAISYIALLMEKAKPAVLGNEALNKIIEERKQQYNAWLAIKNVEEKVVDGTITDEEIEGLYKNVVSLLAENSTPVMKNYATTLLQKVKNKINIFFNKTKPSDLDIQQVSKYLRLFRLEKLETEENKKDVDPLFKARKEISALVIEKINAVIDLDELDKMLVHIQSVWPDRIESAYIEIENQSKADYFVTEGKRVDMLPSYICPNAEERNYVVAVGSVTLKAGEKRVFRCNPIIKDPQLQEALSQKAKSLVPLDNTIKKIDSKFKERINFLKKRERSALEKIWEFITGDKETPLTQENQQKYVDQLVEGYSDVLFEQMLNGTTDERRWVNKRVAQDVEDVAEAINVNVNHLCPPAKSEKTAVPEEKIDRVDMGHLLLQWKFICRFREKFANTAAALSVNAVYKHVGAGIIYKMDEIAKNHPKFIHEFLGKMTKEQLEVFYSTFSGRQQADEVNLDDISGEKTVLPQSLLLSAVSALIQQELTRFLNGESVDMKLLEQHIDFVAKYLPTLKEDAKHVNASPLAAKLKQDLTSEMDLLLTKDDRQLEKSIYQLAMDLTQLLGFMQNESDLKAFCEKHDLNMAAVQKRQDGLQKIKENIFNALHGNGKLSDIFKKADEGTIKFADIYIKTVLKHKNLTTLSGMQNYYTHLNDNHEKIQTAQDPFDLVGYVKNLTDDVILSLSPELKEVVYQIQYAFSDKLTTSLSQILGNSNLKSVPEVEAKLTKLKTSPAFSKLAAQLFEHEEDRENLFTIYKSSSASDAKEAQSIEQASLRKFSIFNRKAAPVHQINNEKLQQGCTV
jgi:hypothetical protein